MTPTELNTAPGAARFLDLLRDAERDADALLASAAAECEKILADARDGAAALVDAARTHGAESRRARIAAAEARAREIAASAAGIPAPADNAGIPAPADNAGVPADAAAVRAVAERIVKPYVDR